MSFIDGLRHRTGVWLHRSEYERGIADELRFHLDLDAAQRNEAALDVRRRFGNVTYLQEETRHVARLDRFDGILQDVRHLFRSLRRSPGFAAVTILTLALGIGATTAVLSVVDHVLIHSLPFRDAGRIMMLLERGDRGGLRTPSAPTAEDWRRDPGVAQAFEQVAFIRGDGLPLRVGDETETIGVGFVGPEFFTLLGAKPVLGRLLNDDDQRADAAPAAVIAYTLWQRRFGGDPAVLRRRITLGGVLVTVVGVMPNGAVYPGFALAWEAIAQNPHK